MFDNLFVFKKSIDNREKPNQRNSIFSKGTVHRGRFTTVDSNQVVQHYSVAVKKILGISVSTTSTERAIENLKFLSLPGNNHPNFIRFFKEETKGEFT